jgi:hypothetical protein
MSLVLLCVLAVIKKRPSLAGGGFSFVGSVLLVRWAVLMKKIEGSC